MKVNEESHIIIPKHEGENIPLTNKRALKYYRERPKIFSKKNMIYISLVFFSILILGGCILFYINRNKNPKGIDNEDFRLGIFSSEKSKKKFSIFDMDETEEGKKRKKKKKLKTKKKGKIKKKEIDKLGMNLDEEDKEILKDLLEKYLKRKKKLKKKSIIKIKKKPKKPKKKHLIKSKKKSKHKKLKKHKKKSKKKKLINREEIEANYEHIHREKNFNKPLARNEEVILFYDKANEYYNNFNKQPILERNKNMDKKIEVLEEQKNIESYEEKEKRIGNKTKEFNNIKNKDILVNENKEKGKIKNHGKRTKLFDGNKEGINGEQESINLKLNNNLFKNKKGQNNNNTFK